MNTNNEFKTDVAKMRSLMERMEKPHTHAQALLSESKMIEEATTPTRQLKSAEEAFDLLDKIGNNKFVTIGYVTGVSMETPIKRKNPATNKQKSYPDWEGLAQTTGTKGEISELVKVTSYNLRYNKVLKKYHAEYEQFKNQHLVTSKKQYRSEKELIGIEKNYYSNSSFNIICIVFNI